jgi:hypothetical protein
VTVNTSQYCDDQVGFKRGDGKIAPSSPVSYTHGFISDSLPYRNYIRVAKFPLSKVINPEDGKCSVCQNIGKHPMQHFSTKN